MEAWEVRLIDEYNTLKDRTIKLDKMLRQWDSNKLEFNPKTSKELLKAQLSIMNAYMAVLEERIRVEGINP